MNGMVNNALALVLFPTSLELQSLERSFGSRIDLGRAFVPTNKKRIMTLMVLFFLLSILPLQPPLHNA